MKIFIDSANLDEIKKYLDWGVCDGVTTNPTICLKCGVNGAGGMTKRIIDIAGLINPLPLSVEVTSDKPEEILTEARIYSRLAENIVIKITVTDKDGNSLLPVVKKLVSEGVRVNVTTLMTFNQAILTARSIANGQKENKRPVIAGKDYANYISIFAGRISEEHGVEQAQRVLENFRDWLDFHNYNGIEIIVGSVRSQENIELWSRSGAHILTIPPEVIQKSMVSARTKETVIQFLNDAKKSMNQLQSGN